MKKTLQVLNDLKREGVFEDMDTVEAVMEKALIAKEARHRRLARLPALEKVRILVRMQKMAAPLLKAQGRIGRVWEIGKNPDGVKTS